VKPVDELLTPLHSKTLTNHDPRPPFTVIGISSDKKQCYELDGKDDTSEVEHNSTDYGSQRRSSDGKDLLTRQSLCSPFHLTVREGEGEHQLELG
jgi:hypothetical protein